MQSFSSQPAPSTKLKGRSCLCFACKEELQVGGLKGLCSRMDWKWMEWHDQMMP